MGGIPDPVDWSKDPYWTQRRFSPAQILVFDVRIAVKPWQTNDPNAGAWIEMFETLSSSLVDDLQARDHLSETVDVEKLPTANRTEQRKLKEMIHEYGWLNCLRGEGIQKTVDDPQNFRKVRWVHMSSKFTEYLQGCFIALSNWKQPQAAESILAGFRQIEQSVQQNERFSKHGRYFSPFFEPLSESKDGPFLICVPFLDWTVEGEPPALRFQVDPREGYQSTRGSAHVLRTILQHYYRLEDTRDRESQQCFTKHKPWATDRYLDLKVRRWYGEYPSALNVDELWILVIDPQHIVTFSSNQSWKSRWPPLQFASRVMEISFRAIRNDLYHLGDGSSDYSAYTHSAACLTGALGLLHRYFWTDLPLSLVDRYASYLSHLQYRLLRSPSTKLVMDLLQVQEELNIIIQLMNQQMELIEDIQTEFSAEGIELLSPPRSRASSTIHRKRMSLPPKIVNQTTRTTYKRFGSSFHTDPMQQLHDNLRREHVDICELRDHCNTLVQRTIQLVNIRLEDHGKAILVFTIVTIIFLPLSFASSYFGMNTVDIRNLQSTQSLFWIVACSLTVGVVGFSLFLAFYGGDLMEAFIEWRAKRKPFPRRLKNLNQNTGSANLRPGQQSFEVLGTTSF
ncbi:hypothetical protein BT63DRAFT_15750 [Microthyrium microscopicum]|uniref:Cora-domain-containing protein n=1 Tax=Microthyrium microscopicum TaxID=703497 RepID=A0A6A6UUJ9_9PEZI|nr:hypothetical protein BT63DRAFT_15750 [Microthyrium microscopicum]